MSSSLVRTPTVLAVLFTLAACARGSAGGSLEAKLPVSPGAPWDDARGQLEKLDPNARLMEGLGGRTAVAHTQLEIAGYRFEELSIAGAVARPSVRTVTLTAPSPAAGCDRARDDLLKALGSDWTAGDLRLGAVTATKGTTRSARIVCTGAELSVSIVG
ncbi:conserved hypothetical protein [Anaeromyxobacter sp. K]|uniref:Lipoprotein n=1 Tax=Anaeromyxobacter dehalogenans (strain ATCC BAA-258 / DSM 21875 / 2CP-1) TaxID=455488 RepID=B8JG84_ANAD2|nr:MULTISPECIES: hypothetical protein [Anaeromyxobacter]ACG74266.1 conserved hypothetical protein [Anaeromyxobacter sp. K]ACL66487.1 conserved hypothetical protein [Anaeromyxobacter dehalogenans 2CP-1]